MTWKDLFNETNGAELAITVVGRTIRVRYRVGDANSTRELTPEELAEQLAAFCRGLGVKMDGVGSGDFADMLELKKAQLADVEKEVERLSAQRYRLRQELRILLRTTEQLRAVADGESQGKRKKRKLTPEQLEAMRENAAKARAAKARAAHAKKRRQAA